MCLWWCLPHSSTALWGCMQMSCHPELNQYIQDTLHCVKPLLEKVREPQVLRDTPYLFASGLILWGVLVSLNNQKLPPPR